MTAENYVELVDNLYNLILSETRQALSDTTDLNTTYPKIVVMYEFFRMIRGEAFIDLRPSTPDHQGSFYKMEDEIRSNLDLLKSKLDFSDEKLKFNLKQIGAPYLEK